MRLIRAELPEAAEAARSRRRRGRRYDRPRRDRVHRPLDPACLESEKYDPAGGIDNFSGSIELLTQIGVVAAILIGATVGAGDRGAGVFRELVVTGRSRLALFAARLPGGFRVCCRSSPPRTRSPRWLPSR